MVWILWGCLCLGALIALAIFYEELEQWLIESGVKLPSSRYLKRGRALYLPLIDDGGKIWREGEGVLVRRELDEIPMHVTIRQHTTEESVGKPSSLAVEMRFIVAPLGDVHAQFKPVIFSTSRHAHATGILDVTWKEQCLTPSVPEHVYVSGIDDLEDVREPLPIRLALALLLAHRNLDTLDAITQSPLSKREGALSTCTMTHIERRRQSLSLTYHGQIMPEASAEDEQRIMQTLLNHARYIARGLGEGALLTRCFEHLELPHDDPPGIKSLSAQVLADQLLKLDDRAEHRATRQRFIDLIWQHQEHYMLQDLVAWIGPGVIDQLSDEQLRAHGEQESSEVLRQALLARYSRLEVLNDSALCWALRQELLREVLREDEGLAIHGPPLFKSLSEQSLAMCLGFLAKHASPVLWRAPWFTKQVDARLSEFGTTGWRTLYEHAFGKEAEFEQTFTSTRIAIDVLCEASSRALEHNPDRFQHAELMHYQVISFMTRREGASAAPRWNQFVRGLTIDQINRVLRQSWLWEGQPFLFLREVSARPGFGGIVRRYPDTFDLMLTTFEVASKRRDEPIEPRLLYELIMHIEPSLHRLGATRHDDVLGRLVRTFTEQVEAYGPNADAVVMLRALRSKVVSSNLGTMVDYTLKVWVNGLKDAHLVGAMTHVEVRPELAGGLSLNDEAEGQRRD